MEKWILAVGYDEIQFADAQAEWLKYGILIRVVANIAYAIQELSHNHDYLLVAIFSKENTFLSELPTLRSITHAPILVMTHQYSDKEKIEVLEAGADEYIEWSESLVGSVASGRALIRRYTELNQVQARPLNIVLRGDVFISLDYRKVFIHAKEIELPRREFDLFLLLVSNPGRVFSPEQLYRLVWGDEYVPTGYGLYSCIRRIRSKLKTIPETSCTIVNKRGVGYSFSQKNT